MAPHTTIECRRPSTVTVMGGMNGVGVAGLCTALVVATGGCHRSEPALAQPVPSTSASATALTTSASGSVGPAGVPGVRNGAEIGQPCELSATYIYGVDASGQVVACVYSDAEHGVWAASSPLVGVRDVGSACQDATVAQSPDGRGLICLQERGFQPGP
jgi:hypothetical protein